MPASTTAAGAPLAGFLSKVLGDPFYGPAYQMLGSIEAVLEAGFFDDGVEQIARADADWMSTPLHKISLRLSSLDADDNRPVVVLLMTGSFNPIHRGHIESMDIARQELESRGYFVAGGYMSPSHDSYVSQKLGDQALPALQRLELCHLATTDSDWLMASGWEAVGVDRAVNFTDVIVWLEAYLARHIKSRTPINVCYVFSSDHAGFCRTFVAKGMCVCTVRPEYADEIDQYAEDEFVMGNVSIIFARQKRELASSSLIAKNGRLDLMEKRSRQRYVEILAERQGIFIMETEPSIYVLRDECGWEIEPWMTGRERAQLLEARQDLLDNLAMLISSVHKRRGKDVAFHWLSLKQQESLMEQLEGKRVLSLDPLIEGRVNLEVSRTFPLACPHAKPMLSERPGSQPLEKQLAAIEPGDYVLVDDDVATGATLKAIKAMLPDAVRIERDFILLQQAANAPKSKLDILDCRDFIAGSRHGGLVVSLPNGVPARVPYCLPYASPSDRASIPLLEELFFSHQIWLLNQSFFNRIEHPILLSEADSAFQKLMTYLGFEPSTPMSEICRWHAEQAQHDLERAVA